MNAYKIVADAYLSITQDISQGINALQKISVDCGENSENCLKAVRLITDLYKNRGEKATNEMIEKETKSVCLCEIDNVSIGNKISVNFSAITDSDAEQSFKKYLNDSLLQESEKTGTKLFFDGDRIKNLDTVTTNIFNSINSTSFTSDIQTLKTVQSVNLKGSGEICNVNLENASDIVSLILQKNKETSAIIEEFQNSIEQYMKITNAGFAQLILWVVRIVMLIIILIVILYSVNIVFNIYTLYV